MDSVSQDDSETSRCPPETPVAVLSESTQSSSKMNSATPSLNKRRRLKPKKSPDQAVDKADEILNVITAKLYNPEDEFSLIGKNIAIKLRRLPKETRIFTEKLFNDILFQAELGNITEHTRITLEKPIETTPKNSSNARSNTLHSNPGWVQVQPAPNNFQLLNLEPACNNYQLPKSVHLGQNVSTSDYYTSLNPIDFSE